VWECRWPCGLLLCLGTLAIAGNAAVSQTLLPGVTVEGEMSAGQRQFYALRAEAGEFFQVTLRQQGIDVVLAVTGAGGARESDFSDGPQGREVVSLIAAAPGDVLIEVRAREGAVGAGRYALALSPPRSASPSDRDRMAAEDLLSRAFALQKDGKAESFREAADSFAKARVLWRALDERFFEGLCLLREGVCRRRLGEHHRARELFEEALPHWRALGEPSFEAKTLDALGTADYFLNDYEKALAHYLEALPLRRAAGDREGEAATLNNISIGHGVLGRLRTSLEWQEQALALHRELGDRRGQASLLHNMAVGSFRTSRMQEALDRLQESLSLSRAVGDRPQQASTIGMQGMVYGVLGEPREALHHYGQALDLWQVLGHRSGQAATLEEIGRAHATLGETGAALDHYRQALDLHRALGDRAESATLLSMGMAYKDQGDLENAARALSEGLRLSIETKNVSREASLLSGLGQVYAAQGDAPQAVDHLERALSLRRRTSDRVEEAFTLHELARVELGLGSLSRARERLEGALELVEAVRQEVARPDLRASLLARAGQVHDLYLDTLMREHARAPAGGFDARAFAASEGSRAQSLLELLAESHLDLREGVDAALLERERSLQERLAFRLDQQMRLLTGPHDEEQAGKAEAEVRAVRGEYQGIQAQIRVASPRYATLRQPAVLTLGEVQQRILDPGTLLLEYALGGERSYVFAVTSAALRTYTLPGRGEVEDAARRAYGLLADRVREARPASDDPLGALSRMLLGPVAAELEGKRLLIVPDGALQYVPFAALPVPGRPAVPLVAEHEMVAIPSASLLAALRAEAAGRRRPGRTLAVFADPVFDQSDERVQPRSGRRLARMETPAPDADRDARQRDLNRSAAESGLLADVLPRLPYTRREARAILALRPETETRAALDFEASRKAARSQDLADYRFVHFATHGFFNNAHPELSGLVLSLVDRDGSPQEGFLSAGEVFNLKLSADLVVLSGCRTAMGKQMKGEGVVGLTRAFMYAGTSRVLASLWKVDDAATAALMTRLYEGMLARALAPAEALRQAQLGLARERRWRHPYYWAGFQLQGDWADAKQ
jgi:CHAT domain-containing protein/tetratricopeptide (TPR) repeat protein